MGKPRECWGQSPKVYEFSHKNQGQLLKSVGRWLERKNAELVGGIHIEFDLEYHEHVAVICVEDV